MLLARQPLPALNPEYLLVAYAAGSVVSSVPLAFPRALLGVGSDNGVRTHLRQPLSEALTSVFIAADPSVDRVAVLATDGAALLELAAADLPAPSHEKARDPLPLSPYGRARQRLRAGELQASYEHIHFLDSAESAFLPQDALAGGRVVDPSEEMNDVISDGLAAVAPAPLGSVQTLAVVEWLAGSRSPAPRAQLVGTAER